MKLYRNQTRDLLAMIGVKRHASLIDGQPSIDCRYSSKVYVYAATLLTSVPTSPSQTSSTKISLACSGPSK